MGWRDRPSDLQLHDCVTHGSAAVAKTVPPPAPVHLRRAQPLLALLPTTRRWLMALPREVRPVALAAQFARIANQLCSAWPHPHECHQCFDELLASKRPHRTGFPASVLREIVTLHAYYRQVR